MVIKFKNFEQHLPAICSNGMLNFFNNFVTIGDGFGASSTTNQIKLGTCFNV